MVLGVIVLHWIGHIIYSMNKWLLVFFLMPLVEMYLLIEVGGWIGPWPTIGLVVLTAVIGVGLLRVQGLATLTRGVNKLNSGGLPAQEMVEGLLLAVAGAVLVTPGFVTDTVGFLLLTPPVRVSIAKVIMSRVKVTTLSGGAAPFGAGHDGARSFDTSAFTETPANDARAPFRTIDGVAEEVVPEGANDDRDRPPPTS